MLGRSKKQNPEKAASEPFTYIHRGTKIVGDVEAEGRVRVHGTVQGNVRISGVLEVAEAGVIEGEHVEADEVKILGRVRANVTARGKIEIWKDGQLEGNVRAAALDIEEGASFTGRSEMVPGRKGAAGRLPEAASTAKHGALQREAAASLGPVKDRATDDGSPEGADVAVPEEEAAAGD
ncbi:MAG TPA: polymer-forming cytoskeletal protein [Trueperaceae bacterium]|nr:polymer-forming cytoskeletal protein [Trueperaceae bacterium]